jgi:hypothetical protein
MNEDPFIELIKQFSEPCDPVGACPGNCWTHSWWEDDATGLEQLAGIASKFRQDPSWLDVSKFKGDEVRCNAPRVNWGMELRKNGFCYWASCTGELTS